MFAQHIKITKLKKYILVFFFVIAGCGVVSDEPVILDSAFTEHYALIKRGETGAARVRLRQFMSKHGESSQPLFLMGLSYHSEKKYAKAVEWFEKSINPKLEIYPPALHYLGWSQFYLGNAKQAGDAFKQFLLIHPEEADSIFALGLLSMEEGNLAEAKEHFSHAVRAEPRNQIIRAKATARWADVLVQLDDWENATGLYRDALSRNPDMYEAWYRYATALKRIGRYKESEQAFASFEQARRRVRPDLYQRTRFPE